MPFQQIHHTADLGVEVTAPSLSALFEEAAQALTSLLCDVATVEPREAWSTRLAASEADLLLHDWLAELLYRFDAHAWLTRQASATVVRQGDDYVVEATVEGERFDTARHELSLLIKAVTYHKLEVARTDDGWRATVIFDI